MSECDKRVTEIPILGRVGKKELPEKVLFKLRPK